MSYEPMTEEEFQRVMRRNALVFGVLNAILIPAVFALPFLILWWLQ